jgi:acetyl-CoA acetyltransferase
MREVVIVSAARTPIGRLAGALAEVRPDDMAALVIQEAVRRAGIDPESIEEVYLGCANQAGEDNRNVARMACCWLACHSHVFRPSHSTGSAPAGLNAVNQAARAIRAGEGEIYIAGGVESMSRAPYSFPKKRSGFPFGQHHRLRHHPGLALSQPQNARDVGTGSDGRDSRKHLRDELRRRGKRRRDYPRGSGCLCL